MARPLRLEYPDALYHVFSRGNERRGIFLSDTDRVDFLHLLSSVVVKEELRLHSYCLMDNHYHLLLNTPLGKLSRGIHSLNARYAQRLNARYERCGHLFEGRFKAIIVERESHLLELHRYIVLNPVRADLVAKPDDWKWSSYRATCGLARAPAWLEVSWTLSQFGGTLDAGRREFMAFVEAGIGSAPVTGPVRSQIFMGSREFIVEVESRIESKRFDAEIPACQRDPTSPTLADIEALVAREWRVSISQLRRHRGGEAKLAAIYLARRLSHVSAKEVGANFGVGRGRIANVVAEIDRGRHQELRPRLEGLMAELRRSGPTDRQET